MKSDTQYRFSLSWGMETEENILTGEFLEKLGNKKSKFIIQLISEHLQANPELIDSKNAIKLVINSSNGNSQLKETIREIIKSELEKLDVSKQIKEHPNNSPENTDKTEGIASMLENLSAWDI